MVRLLPILSFFTIASVTAWACANHPAPDSKEEHDLFTAGASFDKNFFSAPKSNNESAGGAARGRQRSTFSPRQGTFGTAGPLNRGVPVRGAVSVPRGCSWGKPCGNTCISRLAECKLPQSKGVSRGVSSRAPRGVASSRAPKAPACAKTCWRGKACGNECISRLGTCTKPRGTACDP